MSAFEPGDEPRPGAPWRIWRSLMMTRLHAAVLLALAAVSIGPAFLFAQAPTPAASSISARTEPVLAPHGMVASQEARATRIGVEVLEKGGNAIDAAVAVGFALAVTYPQAGNIGGGGFMLIHLADRREEIAIDYRETAPQATPTRENRATAGLRSACRARPQGLSSHWKNTAPAASRRAN
jgi:gamma-glutamyltranspeptidase / glutathione hydrolase